MRTHASSIPSVADAQSQYPQISLNVDVVAKLIDTVIFSKLIRREDVGEAWKLRELSARDLRQISVERMTFRAKVSEVATMSTTTILIRLQVSCEIVEADQHGHRSMVDWIEHCFAAIDVHTVVDVGFVHLADIQDNVVQILAISPSSRDKRVAPRVGRG